MNFVLNGQATGDVAGTLMQHNFDAGALRPYVGEDGRSRITVNHGGRNASIVTNANATLRKDEWIQLDTAVVKAAKPRLAVVGRLRAAGLAYTIPNGMGKTSLEHETQSDIGDATVSMDGLREGDRSRPHYALSSLPLPIIHKDFSFSARQIMASRNGGSPLDTTMAELAARRVAEEAEKLTLGVSTGINYGGGQVYGFTNFPSRLTKTITTPTSSNHATTVSEVLAMIKQAMDAGYYGPYDLWYSPAWHGFMNEDYSTAKGDNTLRERLLKIENIEGVLPADYLTGTTLVLVQRTPDVARMVVGMDITTVQWETQGGMMLNFKVMAILVPQMRADFSGNCGIVHGSV